MKTPEAEAALDQAAAILARGGLVALPTETVYGLGANALDAQAVASIFAAKQRPAWDPVIVHISERSELAGLVGELPAAAERLIEAFWPGPLTLLLPRSAAISDAVTAGRPLVGIRMPAHPVAAELIRRAGVPVAAPSANLFAHTSPTTAAHVLEDLEGRIDAIVDAGPCLHGVESTVLDPCQTPMVLYRPGAITKRQLEEASGVAVTLFRAPESEHPPESLPSPGVGIRHYAPRARVWLLELDKAAQNTPAGQIAQLNSLLAAKARELSGERIGVMLPDECTAPEEATACFKWGSWRNAAALAQGLYAGLRALDDAAVTAILCPLPAEEEIGLAIGDRLRKAAKS